jgi:hypothetical protein
MKVDLYLSPITSAIGSANHFHPQSSSVPSATERLIDCADNPLLAFQAFFHWCYHATYDCPSTNSDTADHDFHREVYKIALRYGVPELMQLSLTRFRVSLNEPGAWKQRPFFNLLVDQWRGQHPSSEPRELLGPPLQVLKAHIFNNNAELGPHIQLRQLVSNTPALEAAVYGKTADSKDAREGSSQRSKNPFASSQDSSLLGSLRNPFSSSNEASTNSDSRSGRYSSSQPPSSFGDVAEARKFA